MNLTIVMQKMCTYPLKMVQDNIHISVFIVKCLNDLTFHHIT